MSESPKKIFGQASSHERKAPDETMHELRTKFAGTSFEKASIEPIDKKRDLWRLELVGYDGKTFTSGPLTSRDIRFMASEWNLFYYTRWSLANFELPLSATWYSHDVNLWGLLAGFQGESARQVIENIVSSLEYE